jgi:hypothetical protein
MTQDEILSVVDLIKRQADEIINGQTILKNIKNRLDTSRLFPSEESLIYRDHYGEQPNEPRRIRIGNTLITSRILHRQGISQSDISGADLLYEIEGVKFMLIQYKKVNSVNRVSLDADQLDSIIANCPVDCNFSTAVLGKIDGRCGSWYCVHDNEGKDAVYVQACQAKNIFGKHESKGRKSFDEGISRVVFDELFAKCRTGARVSFSNVAAYAVESVNNNRLLFAINQRTILPRFDR